MQDLSSRLAPAQGGAAQSRQHNTHQPIASAGSTQSSQTAVCPQPPVQRASGEVKAQSTSSSLLGTHTVLSQPNTPPQAARSVDSACCLAHAQDPASTRSSFQDAASGSLDAIATSHWTAPIPAQIPSSRPPTTSAASKSTSQQSLHSLCTVQ